MKTKNHSFLSDYTNQKLINFCEFTDTQALSAYDIILPIESKDVPVVSLNRFESWINSLADILARQTIGKKLSSRQVYALERKHFEEKLEAIGSPRTHADADIFVGLDTKDNDLCYQILTQQSIPLSKGIGEDRYITTESLLSSFPLRSIIASILFDVGGYNSFFGLNYEINLLEMMDAMNSPVNLITEESIIPIRVFADFVEIQQASELVINICHMKIGADGDPYFAEFSSDIDLDRYLLEKKSKVFCFKISLP